MSDVDTVEAVIIQLSAAVAECYANEPRNREILETLLKGYAVALSVESEAVCRNRLQVLAKLLYHGYRKLWNYRAGEILRSYVPT